MPRPIFEGMQNNKNQSHLEFGTVPQSTYMSEVQIQRLLRKNRSKEYLDAMKMLDAGGHTLNQNDINKLKETIRSELPGLGDTSLPIGIVAKCYLGDNYEVHTLDLLSNIVQHYKYFQVLPPLLERARSLALHPEYEIVEVYSDGIRAVRKNGKVAVVK